MATLEAIVEGTTYDLSTSSGTAQLIAAQGIGMAPVRRLIERGPFQHGVTDRGFRLDARQVRLAFVDRRNTLSDLDDNRQTIYEVFKPRNTAFTLRITGDNGDVRQIKMHTVGAMDMPWVPTGDRIGTSQVFSVTAQAPDPLWENPTASSHAFQATGSGLAISLDIPLQIAGTTIDESRSITYNGSFRVFPTITIDGPITDCVITNTTTGDKLDFTGVTIADGDTYTIDLTYGSKTVEDSSGTNKIADLTDDSDIATWHIAAKPDVSGGVNTITVTGTSGGDNTLVAIQYNEKYIGQ